MENIQPLFFLTLTIILVIPILCNFLKTEYFANKKTEIIANAVWSDEASGISGIEICSADSSWDELLGYLEKEILLYLDHLKRVLTLLTHDIPKPSQYMHQNILLLIRLSWKNIQGHDRSFFFF